MPENEIRIRCPSCSESFFDQIPVSARARSMFTTHLTIAHGLHPDSGDIEFDRAVREASSKPLGTQLPVFEIELPHDRKTVRGILVGECLRLEIDFYGNGTSESVLIPMEQAIAAVRRLALRFGKEWEIGRPPPGGILYADSDGNRVCFPKRSSG